jgi:hypothetical protein
MATISILHGSRSIAGRVPVSHCDALSISGPASILQKAQLPGAKPECEQEFSLASSGDWRLGARIALCGSGLFWIAVATVLYNLS